MGLPIAAISEQETIGHILSSVTARRGGWVCPANLDVLRQWHRSEPVQDLIGQADLVVADGMPLIWASELLGSPLPERVAGSTLILSLTAAAADTGASVFLLGGNPGTAETAVDELKGHSPDLRIAGTLCPPFGFETDPEWTDRIRRELMASRPDIVFVGLGFPKQERLIVELRRLLPEAWFISCGVSFSFVSGEIRRAPQLMQRLGLEWLHRMAQEPKRLYRRYLLEGVPFLMALMCSSIVRRAQHGRLGAPAEQLGV